MLLRRGPTSSLWALLALAIAGCGLDVQVVEIQGSVSLEPPIPRGEYEDQKVLVNVVKDRDRIEAATLDGISLEIKSPQPGQDLSFVRSIEVLGVLDEQEELLGNATILTRGITAIDLVIPEDLDFRPFVRYPTFTILYRLVLSEALEEDTMSLKVRMKATVDMDLF